MAHLQGQLKITPKVERAIAALVSEPTIAAAAEASGVAVRTLFRWLQDPDFREAYHEARRQIISHAVTRLQQATDEAVEALVKRARGYQFTEEEFKRMPIGGVIRIKKTRKQLHPDTAAAVAILQLAFKGVEIEELEARIAKLEEIARGKRK
jgi:hypothetical protein